jgi:general secretion pathway protein G
MNKLIRRRRNRRSGFTLLEILIVVGIIALLAAFVVPNLMGAGNQARIDLAKSAVDTSNGPIATALNLYKLAMGEYPAELKQLSERPDNDEQKKWAGPYLDPTKLKDPWGEEYRYRQESQTEGADKYDLWSKGPDKQDGSEDDITSWAKE